MQLRLVDDARHAWRWSSVRCIALGATVQGVVVSCPATVAQHVPEWAWQSLSGFSLLCMIAAAAGRVTTTEASNVQPPIAGQ